jgi:Flp pilus assembly protein TadG
MSTAAHTQRTERGAVLVHVALALLALTAVSAFVFDFGVFWLSRREAQNSADAGAMGGAIALAYDNATDLTVSGPAKSSALAMATTNHVWGEPPAVDPNTDITFPTCPDGTSTCVRVDVYRSAERGNPLPMFFGHLVGLTTQNIRATATAESMVANATRCMKPWIIPDKWEEHYPIDPGTWDPETSKFSTTTGSGANVQPLPDPDQYRPPTDPSMTGFRASGTPNDIGIELTLKAGPPPEQAAGGATEPGWVYPVRLNEDEPGGAVYRDNIQHCSGDLIQIGDLLRNETGIMVGPTFQGVDPLIAADPTAHWVDPDGPGGEPGHVEGSCMESASCPPPYSQSPTRSPRLITIPVFDTSEFQANPGAAYLRVVNILGFFLAERQGNTIHGYLTTFEGEAAGGGDPIADDAAFSHTIVLVR